MEPTIYHVPIMDRSINSIRASGSAIRVKVLITRSPDMSLARLIKKNPHISQFSIKTEIGVGKVGKNQEFPDHPISRRDFVKKKRYGTVLFINKKTKLSSLIIGGRGLKKNWKRKFRIFF